MHAQQESVIRECLVASLAGKISFGDVVGRLMGIGLERYHADYTRGETTYYFPDGETLVVSTAGTGTATDAGHAQPIAEDFDVEAVQGAIRGAQRGEVLYPEFVRLTTAAGCVGYFVQLTGRRVQYFGRTGEVYIEPFPS